MYTNAACHVVGYIRNKSARVQRPPGVGVFPTKGWGVKKFAPCLESSFPPFETQGKQSLSPGEVPGILLGCPDLGPLQGGFKRFMPQNMYSLFGPSETLDSTGLTTRNAEKQCCWESKISGNKRGTGTGRSKNVTTYFSKCHDIC